MASHIDFKQFDPPADIVHADHLGALKQGPLDHAVVDRFITSVVAAINLAWLYLTFGFRMMTHTLQHLHDSVHKAIDGDLVGATVGGLFDYTAHCVGAAQGLFNATFDAGHVLVFGTPYHGDE